MASSRSDLHDVLKAILGSNNVYFQPPENITMVYPCIIYSRETVDKHNANNKGYVVINQWKITSIDTDPEGTLADKILDLPMCELTTHFVTRNLVHDVFTLYY